MITEMEVKLSMNGVAKFTDLPLPKAETKEFSEQEYSLEVWEESMESRESKCLFRKNFHYASMSSSSS